MKAAYEIAFEKGRGADEPRARLGNGRDQRLVKGGGSMSRNSMRAQGVNFSPRRISHPILSEPEAAQEFSAVILDFSAGELARAAGRSKDTAKCWKAGRAFPNGVSLMALVSEFKPVRLWVESKVGALDSPRGMAEGFALLEQIMTSNTPEGRAMRARALELAREPS